MKKLCLVAVAGLALSTSVAFAADLGQPYVKAPPAPPPPPSWTGFYIGVNGGWGFNRDTGDEACINPAGVVGGAGCWDGIGSIVKPEGGLAGGQIGYNWQSGIVVYGIEADIQWADIKDTASATAVCPPACGPANGDYTASQKLDWFGTVRGRLGITPWANNALLYITGGLIYGQEKVASDVFFPTTGQEYFASDSSTRTGGTVGVGLEYLFTPNLSGKIEGLWYDMGSETLFAPALFPNGFASRSTFHFDGAIVRAGLNWHFNWGGGGPGPYEGQY
jgi:outer membrane immunogenic protein